MLSGKSNTGKTTTIDLVYKELIKRGATSIRERTGYNQNDNSRFRYKGIGKMRNKNMFLKAVAMSTAMALLFVVLSSCEKKYLGKQENQNQDRDWNDDRTQPVYTDGNGGGLDTNEMKANIEALKLFIGNNGPRLHYSGGESIRTLMDTALFKPMTIVHPYLSAFDSLYLPRGSMPDILDTAITHKKAIEYLWFEFGKPLPLNAENIQNLYDLCDTIEKKCYEMDDLYAKLDSMRNILPNVGIPVYGAIRKEDLRLMIKEFDRLLKREIESCSNKLQALAAERKQQGEYFTFSAPHKIRAGKNNKIFMQRLLMLRSA
jgi:hypothetical protein